MREFKLIALTPPSLPEPSIAIAASMAGGLGVLDLEYTQDKRLLSVPDTLATLARYARDDYGIKLSSHARVAEEVAGLISDLPRKPRFAILACREKNGNIDTHRKQVEALHNQGFMVLWEAICLEEAQFGEQIGVDGVIAKGHESGGRIGQETTFILLQRLLRDLTLPVYAQGGIGLHTASACYASGAAGVVLDSQLLLTRESPLPEEAKERIAVMDGSETACLGHALGETYRVYSRSNMPVIEELRQVEMRLLKDGQPLSAPAEFWGNAGGVRPPQAEILEEWRQSILGKAGWDSPEADLLLLGQDAAFAAPLAKRFVTVGGIMQGIRQAIESHVQMAHDLHPLDEDSSLTRSLGIRYPVFQGPMARISDTPSFAAEVAEAGGLPFLAVSLMPADELKELLEETHRLLRNRPWGVGLIGFLPPRLFSKQLKVICECHPPFALIAGGRPKQNRPLEEAGITTYMHIPSTGLLEIFLQNGDKHFILEGRESGGHVGPRTSFVLWNAMIDRILEHISKPSVDASEYHVLFAGGIHDALSASMVAVMAAPLAQLGVRVGVQMGTAYLFTEELVRTGGITDIYQKEAIKCGRTVVLEVGPGHANRCICTPFAESFDEEKQKLKRDGRSGEEIRLALEQLSIGRLYIAAKGTELVNTNEGSKITELSPEKQLERGVYMIGQVGAIKDKAFDVKTLHREVSVESTKLLDDLYQRTHELKLSRSKEKKHPVSDIAIIGMESVFPKAQSKQAYWENILNRVNTVIEVPEERWDYELYYDPDPRAKDKVYSKWGCFLDDVLFDPVEYGMPPNTIPSIEPLQLITLEMVKGALKDAGYIGRPFPRERTSVIIGTGGGGADLAQGYGARSSFPMLFGSSSSEALSYYDGFLPEWTEDSFAGILMNVTAGRVANRFDLGGENYTVDAACASSMAAVHLAVKELNTYNSDMVIVGGADTMQNAFAYLCFSKTMALSPNGQCRTMDEKADGIVLGEGIAVLVLKRLEDAERDGDKIYAVIKAVGASSDGRDKSMTAPRPEGQALALRRAYQRAGVSPSTIELIEAHGTGTVAGDRAEIQALTQVFNGAGIPRQYCAIGSVKSMIGHTKCSAGLAGVMKVALALHHKVLPPTIGVECPNPSANFPESPFYVNTEARPWIDSGNEHPRRAGVSAFGFGGTNFHAVLEEYTGYEGNGEHVFPTQEWPSELFLWRVSSRQEIVEKIETLEKSLSQVEESGSGFQPNLRDLAFSVFKDSRRKEGRFCLAIVTTSLDELRQKLTWAREGLTKYAEVNDPRGIYYTEKPLGLPSAEELAGDQDGKIAFLFPGQGSQYANMLIDLTIQFPEVRAQFERANEVLSGKLDVPLSRYIFPQPSFTEEENLAREQVLKQTNIAQPAIGTASMGMFHLLETLDVRPDFVAGHSYGEYVALCAAGVFDADVLITLSEARGRFIVESAGENPGKMAAINADASVVSEVIAQIDGVYIANENSPDQTVITGTEEGVRQAVEKFEAQSIRAKIIPVACAFHSPIVAPACERLAEFLSGVELSAPEVKVFSNTTASIYPEEPEAIAELLVDHLVNPIKFAREIEAMYEAGARIFIEVGPQSILTKLTNRIISDKPRLVVASDQPGRNGLTQIQHLLGQLAVHGVPINLDRFYQGREVKLLDLNNLPEIAEPTPSPTTWLVNGHRAKQISEASNPEMLPPQLNLSVTGESGKSRGGKIVNSHESGARKREDMRIKQIDSSALEAGTGGSNIMRNESAGVRFNSHTEDTDLSVSQVERKQSNYLQSDSINSEITYSNEPGDGVSQVMIQYQQLMNRFLDTQKSVMLTYLQSNNHRPLQKKEGRREAITSRLSSSTISHPSPDVRPPVPKQAIPPPLTSVAPPAMDGVLSVKDRDDEEETRTPDSTEAVAADSTDLGLPSAEELEVKIPTKQELTELLLKVVSERTGYPEEMLDLDLDMEADLGIDSIKRIEILGSLQGVYALDEQDEDLQNPDAIEELASLKTLRGIIAWIENGIEKAINAEAASRPLPVREENLPVDTGAQTLQAVSEAELSLKKNGLTDEASDLGLPSAEDEEKRGREVKLEQEDSLLSDRPEPSEVPEQVISRYTLVADKKPLGEESKITLPNRVLILTDDECGMADGLAKSLQTIGHTVALVGMGEKVQQVDRTSYVADLTKMESVAELLRLIRQEYGPIGGLIHLLPLKPVESFEEMDLVSWGDRLKLEIKSLFYFAKELGEELKEAASSGDACFMAATEMGGTFASAVSEDVVFSPGQGGVAGLLKAIAREWPYVRIKSVDLSPDEPVSTRVHQLMQEITSDDGMVEVGYPNGDRYILMPKLAPVDKTESVLDIDSSWVILVTGGARGITADVAIELAQSYQPTLLLVGSSALPESEESPETLGLTEPQELKAAIMERMRKTGQTAIAPSQVEAAYSRLLKDREMRRNIAKMLSVGAKVHYYQADVRDAERFGNLIDEIYQTFGRLDGVIHGAGIIEDKLVRDKTPESFDRVFDTKVNSVFTLSRKLKAEKLSFFVIFSSVAGRFGNRGQSDYAAANEVYSKLAIYLDRLWPGRVVSVIWGPWSRSGGMVSAELEKQFAKHGIELVPRSVGPRKLDEELRYGRKGDVEVILGGRGWDARRVEGRMRLSAKSKLEAESGISPALHTLSLPLIGDGDTFSREADGTVRLIRKLDVAKDIHLNDHKLDGKPVLPMAMAMELMAEVASLGWQHLQLSEINNLQVLHGIVLEDGQLDIQVVAKPLHETHVQALRKLDQDNSDVAKPDPRDAIARTEVSIVSAKEPKRMYYRANAELQKEPLPPVSQMSIYLEEERPFPMGVQEAYHKWLFHGPVFQGIAEIEGVGTNGIIAKLKSSHPRDCLVMSEQPGTLEWIIDPVVIDSGLQLIILWARQNLDMTPLPSRMLRYRRFGSMYGRKVECQVHVNISSVSNILSNKLVFFGEDGRLLGLMEGMEAVCSKALNRLGSARL